LKQDENAAARQGPDVPGVLDLPDAAKLLGIGRTFAYQLVREGKWPTPVLRVGRLIKIPARPLLDLISESRKTA
jgi:excisionase family DNA binding protein